MPGSRWFAYELLVIVAVALLAALAANGPLRTAHSAPASGVGTPAPALSRGCLVVAERNGESQWCSLGGVTRHTPADVRSPGI